MDWNIDEIIEQLIQHEKDARPSDKHIDLAIQILGKLSIRQNNDLICSLSYFLRYGYIPISACSVSEIGKFIGSAPWVGFEGESLTTAIKELFKKDLLVFTTIPELNNQLCACLNFNPKFSDTWLNQLLTRLLGKTQHQIAKRSNIIENYDWTHGNKIQNQMRDIISNAPEGSVIKMIAYHGRTWLPSSNGVLGFILDEIQKRNDLKFKILVIDPNAKGRVIEGGTPEANKRASSLILSVLRSKHLSITTLSKFDLRTYGKIEEDSLMRGLIVENFEGKIVSCFVTTWFFGSDRGFYGREIRLDGDSSLALLLKHYFDRVFEKGMPQLNPLQMVFWFIKTYWFVLLTLVIIPIICIIILILDNSRQVLIGITVGSLLSGLSTWRSKIN